MEQGCRHSLQLPVRSAQNSFTFLSSEVRPLLLRVLNTDFLPHPQFLPACLSPRPSGATPGWPPHLGSGRSRWETQHPGGFSAWLLYSFLAIGLLRIISWQQRQGETQLFKP